ncbi:hypothetical protein IWW56_003285 [Coemansia sp. RSA 2131]|nr:hypothetical protein IWW56_003285 [Coemansia sp. RSA 2131]
MGNGMFCDDESYWCEQSDDEKLIEESRKTLQYLKTAQRRLNMLMKRKAHYESNPLGSAMCREMQTSISQQAMLIRRHYDELSTIAYEYSHVESDVQKSTQEDWEEVMQLASMPIDMLLARPQSRSNNTVASSSSSCYSMLRTTHYNSPMSGSTANESEQRTLWQMTPPIEEVAELRQRLKELEQTPLFTDACPMHKLAKLTTGQRSPRSLQ